MALFLPAPKESAMADEGQDGFDVLRDEVAANGEVLAVRMERLRNATGKGRLGKWVVEEIDANLRRRGLNHTPLSESNAWAEVLVYVMGGEVERIVDAVQNPSEHAAETLRTATNDTSSETLRQIRALVETG
jgi:hypothetical protein